MTRKKYMYMFFKVPRIWNKVNVKKAIAQWDITRPKKFI